MYASAFVSATFVAFGATPDPAPAVSSALSRSENATTAQFTSLRPTSAASAASAAS